MLPICNRGNWGRGKIMQWIVTGIGILLLMVLLPWAIVASKKSARGKGRLAGATLAIGLIFGGIFDPAKSAAMEAAQKKKEVGDHESSASGDLID